MNAAASVAITATWLWLGMVIAISFIEAPIKFRAPGVTLAIGLGIGRMVFRVLNSVEAVLAVALLIAVTVGDWHGVSIPVVSGLAAAVLAIQLIAVRPALTRRSNAVLDGYDGPRSNIHYVYVALELLKVGFLIAAGVLILVG